MKKTTEQFIEDAKKVHGDDYDYSLVEYKNSKEKVKIICNICKKILNMKPSVHLRGCGCKSCKLRKTQKQFLDDMKNIYGDTLDFSKSVYKTMEDKITFSCPEHGEFTCRTSSLYRGCGCPIHKGIKKAEFQFIKEINDKYRGKYTIYNYNGTHSIIDVVCNKCGNSFKKEARQLLKGYGCDCENPKINSLERFVEKAKEIHGDKYDYSKSIYKGRHKKILIKCNNKNCQRYFWQEAGCHLSGQGCPYCNGTPKKTTKQFIEEANQIHGDRYDYSLVDYKTNHDKVILICKNCGEYFLQTPNAHLSGQNGCPKCQKKSLAEECIAKILTDNNISYIRTKKYDGLKDKQQLSYDFYLPDYNILIEYNGQQHYKFFKKYHKTLHDFHRQLHHDWLKRKYARNNDINLLVIKFCKINKLKIIMREFLTKIKQNDKISKGENKWLKQV